MDTNTDPTKFTSCYKKERFRVAVKISEFEKHWKDHPLVNEYPVAGEPERSIKTFKKLGHWICGRESGWCLRMVRTQHRLDQLTEKLKSQNIKFQVLSFIG